MQQNISRRDFFKLLGLNKPQSALFDGTTTVPAFAGLSENNPPTFALGQFKLAKAKETPSVCSGHGVDCEIIIFTDKTGKVIKIQRDPDHLNNQAFKCCTEDYPQQKCENLDEQAEKQSVDNK